LLAKIFNFLDLDEAILEKDSTGYGYGLLKRNYSELSPAGIILLVTLIS